MTVKSKSCSDCSVSIEFSMVRLMRRDGGRRARLIALLFLRLLLASAGTRAGEVLPFPTLDDAISSKADIWAQYAVESTNGPTYEFLASLLPPLRYVNADFREYPIVLSAPRAAVKARFTSNGSAVYVHGGRRRWSVP